MLEFCGEHNVVSDVEVGGRGGGQGAGGKRGLSGGCKRGRWLTGSVQHGAAQ